MKITFHFLHRKTSLIYILCLLTACQSSKDNETKDNTSSITRSLEPEYRIEPPNWWIGFKNTQLQLMVHKKDIGNTQPQINYPGVSILKTTKGKSNNYLFIDLIIAASTPSGQMKINFTDGNTTVLSHAYQLNKRNGNTSYTKGFDRSDAIYLITPDRFANGDKTNDINPMLIEKRIDRSDNYARHGGDIQGIINHLDYISELGFTALWSTPLLLNDMPSQSYHGYAITDLYSVDPRFGTLNEYIDLAKKTRQKGMKLIMDQVANHCGLNHWWMQDLPFSDWINHQQAFENRKPIVQSNHRRTTNQDRYAAEFDKKGLSEGWFVEQMPDLNQRNPFLATYLIQNSIWWIETLQLGGIRQDTYPYSNKEFMSTWAGAIMREYPHFSIVGEEWSYNPLLIGYWQDGKANKDGYVSNLSHSMDFALQNAIQKGLTKPESWESGLIEIYEALANDFAYADPSRLLLFLDNHDMDRAFTQYKKDPVLLKMALATLLSLARVPQLYYGTEVLAENSAKPNDHGLIRSDFPGGWEGDIVNGFTANGLNKEQKDMQVFLKSLLNFRKTSKAIKEGQTLHFVPFNGVYVLFRIHPEEIVMLVLNKNEAAMNIQLNRFDELNLNGMQLENVLTKEISPWKDSLHLSKKGPYLFQLSRN